MTTDIISRVTDTLYIPCELVVPAPYGGQPARSGYVSVSRTWRTISVLDTDSDPDVRVIDFDPYTDALTPYTESVLLRTGLGLPGDPDHTRVLQTLAIALAGIEVTCP